MQLVQWVRGSKNRNSKTFKSQENLIFVQVIGPEFCDALYILLYYPRNLLQIACQLSIIRTTNKNKRRSSKWLFLIRWIENACSRRIYVIKGLVSFLWKAGCLLWALQTTTTTRAISTTAAATFRITMTGTGWPSYTWWLRHFYRLKGLLSLTIELIDI